MTSRATSPAGSGVGGRWVRWAGPSTRWAASGRADPGQAVRCGLDDDEAHLARLGVVLDDGVAGLGEALREGRHLTRGRVEAADGAVVGVADGDRAVGQLGDAERVLEQRLAGVAVAVAEVEQAGADVGLDDEARRRRVGRHRAQGRGLRVGDPDAVARGGGCEPGRLGEPGVARAGPSTRPSFDVPPTTSTRPLREGVAGRPCPQLVGAGHGDDEPVTEPREVPRRRQRLLEGRSTARALAQLGARACDDMDRAVGESDSLDLVVDRVRDEEVHLEPTGHGRGREQHTLRLVELPLAAPASTLGEQVLLEVHDLVVGRVADDERPVGEGDGLARGSAGRCRAPVAGRRGRHRAGACPWPGAPRSARRRARPGRGRGPPPTSRRRRSPRGR